MLPFLLLNHYEQVMHKGLQEEWNQKQPINRTPTSITFKLDFTFYSFLFSLCLCYFHISAFVRVHCVDRRDSVRLSIHNRCGP